MNKAAFLLALQSQLSDLPKEDLEKTVDYYREIIDDRIEEGLSEEEAVGALGSVEDIVSQVLMGISLPKLVKARVKPSRALKAWEIVLLALGCPVWLPLLIAAASVVFAVYVVLWSVIVTLYAVDLSLAVGGLGGIFGAVVYLISRNFAGGTLYFGVGLVCVGLAVLLFFGFNQITKGLLLLSKRIWLGLKTCFIRKGERRHESI